ncbi:family 43 glycosylhydrolase [Streptomyces lycii]|uniref:Family 43 glycosylhydrolase n=2 Tax=Streptomyces TaxID=1883 RepID=A0ABQ7FF91_9ACTN|nr:family 43 glycosylhydrolase [Streptomyces lycii]KAF4407681.1 family 43 glycosylhydrolase [Streptomyces lycii]
MTATHRRPGRLSRRPARRLAVLLTAAAAAVTGPAATSPAAQALPAAAASSGTYAPAGIGGPVLDRNFPDPDVVKAGNTYHAYATNSDGRNIQRAQSADLVHWTYSDADALPRLGDWAKPETPLVWAPEVFDNGSGFTMHYTARDRATDRQCIGVARSATPEGPFEPVGDGPLVCPADQGGAIDASGYTENGQRHLLWKNDGNCCGRDTWLHIQPVNADGTATTGPATRLIRQDQAWEGDVIEAPTLVKRDGRYVLFYSAASYGGDGYKSSYAVSDSLTGPYTKAAAPLMSTGTFDGTVRGPGGQDVVTGPDGRDRIVFHGWDAATTKRMLYVADLGWANGCPVVRGSKVIHQAERAALNNAVVRDAAGAWDGRAVGKIDHADSHVEFTVFAASAGPHTLTVRYGNGSLSGGAPVAASHTLTVNGSAGGAVTYPHTGWDNWRHTAVEVGLRDGWNTIRLGKGEHYAELDAVEVG